MNLKRICAQSWLTATIISLFLLSACSVAQTSPAKPDVRPLEPISSLELNRYMGQWYEIAKYPNRFQTRCKSNTVAEYSLLNQGGVSVRNSCTDEKGLTTVANGAARLQSKPSTLEVSFAPTWTRWLPMVWANYWVIALEADYRWAVVSEPNRQFLWVLSREKKLAEVDWQKITAAIAAAGLDLNRLEKTIQN
jgi:apolipoprotein D and lipocalin family protein